MIYETSYVITVPLPFHPRAKVFFDLVVENIFLPDRVEPMDELILMETLFFVKSYERPFWGSYHVCDGLVNVVA